MLYYTHFVFVHFCREREKTARKKIHQKRRKTRRSLIRTVATTKPLKTKKQRGTGMAETTAMKAREKALSTTISRITTKRNRSELR